MTNLVATTKFDYDNLFGGNTLPSTVGSEVLAKGQKLKRGALLGMTSDGTLKLVSKKASDGSQNVYAVLCDDTDSTDKVLPVSVYYNGEFNTKRITVTDGDKVSDFRQSARMVGIFFKQIVGA